MKRLRNATTGEIVVAGLERADSWWSRFRGLMLRPSLASTSGLWIEPCSSIHMMWMRFPIDAIWLDREGEVTRVSRSLRPWLGLASGGSRARAVVEVAAGAARGVEVGHRLIVELIVEE